MKTSRAQKESPSEVTPESFEETPVATVSLAGVLTVVGAWVLLIIVYRATEDGFIPVLDHANLAFHEAGHIFFGIFGATLALYGGTLGQLVFPVVVFVKFIRSGALLSAALGALWFFENFLNIARYAADARSQLLPLVGGGDHDWTNILSRWGALSADTAVARTFTTIAWLGMLATVFWVVIVWLRNRNDS